MNGGEPLRLYQNDDLVYGRWSGSRQDALWGFVEGAKISFYEMKEAPARDGTYQSSVGEATLTVDELAFDGNTRWVNGRHRGLFNAVRELDDEQVEEIIELAGDRPRGGFSGLWVINNTEPMEVEQTDEFFTARWEGNVLYGFISGRTMRFYSCLEQVDGSLEGFAGELIFEEAGMSFSGRVNRIDGRYRATWTGMRD